MATLVGNEVPSSQVKATQVYTVTHEGVESLPLLDRSFISFSYGGRNIEDFNVIAVFSGDRLQRAAYAQFEDITTQYEVIDGQFYWGTHFLNNAIDFGLATDGMTEAELEDFKRWFKPGQIKELILAEHPNRAIWARVATPPVYSVVPFEEKVTKKINGMEYSTSSTVYRGEISLSLIMDEPYWFAHNNTIKTYYLDKNNKLDSMTDNNSDEAMETLSDKDFIKIIFEDNVPHTSIKTPDIIFGDEEQAGVTLSDNKLQYFYYPGTATGKPKITFTIKPHFNKDYITYPLNTYSPKILTNLEVNTYNTISLGDSTLKFTIPSLLLGYNEAVDIVSNAKTGEAVEDIRVALRDNVHDYNARGWAMFVLTNMVYNNWGVTDKTALGENFASTFIKYMKYFLCESDTDDTVFPCVITIDSKTGEAIGKFMVRVPTVEWATLSDASDFSTQSVAVLEKNIEDMVRSKYLIIEDHHRINDDGTITINDCSQMMTDYPQEYGGLTDVKLIYKYEYL